MADVNRGNRPLSPHLQIYRLPMTAVSSIMVRITGIALFLYAFFVVWWLLAASTSESAFGFIDWLMRSFFGDLVLFAATWAIWYHMLGRLRHVVWDFGYFLDIETATKLSQLMFIVATALAFLTIVLV